MGNPTSSKTAAPTVDEKSNWLFILETRTQWLLLIQSNTGSEKDSRDSFSDTSTVGGFQTTSSPPNGGRGGANSTSKQGTGNTGAFQGKLSQDDIEQSKKTIFTFSGDTRKLPLLPETPDSGPSAPVS